MPLKASGMPALRVPSRQASRRVAEGEGLAGLRPPRCGALRAAPLRPASAGLRRTRVLIPLTPCAFRRVAEGEGFEPPGPFDPPDFKAGALDHSATLPEHGETDLAARPAGGQPCCSPSSSTRFRSVARVIPSRSDVRARLPSRSLSVRTIISRSRRSKIGSDSLLSSV